MNSSTLIAITPYQSTYPTAQAQSQCSLSTAANQMSGWGFFSLLLLVSCLCFKRWRRKRYEQRSIDYYQRIERLERIWKITTHPEL